MRKNIINQHQRKRGEEEAHAGGITNSRPVLCEPPTQLSQSFSQQHLLKGHSLASPEVDGAGSSQSPTLLMSDAPQS